METARKDGHSGSQGRKQQQEQSKPGWFAQGMGGTTEKASKSAAPHDPEWKGQAPGEPVADKGGKVANLWTQQGTESSKRSPHAADQQRRGEQ